MAKRITLNDVEVGLLLKLVQYKGGFALSHEIHFNDRLRFFKNVLFFLHADRLKYLSYPCNKSLIVLILEEDDF
jgi:hypothetical protein